MAVLRVVSTNWKGMLLAMYKGILLTNYTKHKEMKSNQLNHLTNNNNSKIKSQLPHLCRNLISTLPSIMCKSRSSGNQIRSSRCLKSLPTSSWRLGIVPIRGIYKQCLVTSSMLMVRLRLKVYAKKCHHGITMKVNYFFIYY